MAVFKKNGSYSPIFRHISEVSGEDMVDKVCREANENYYRMLKAHDDLNNAAMMHWKQCCERAAIYVVVKKYYPDSVTEWFDEALREYGVKAGAALNRLLHFPGMKALFLPFMRKIAKNIFGPKGGFKNTFGVVNKDETHFDILDCPYCRYLQELNCPELKPDILITSGGALVKKDGEYIYKAAFSVDRTNELIRTARQVCGDGCEIAIDTVDTHFWNYKIDPKKAELLEKKLPDCDALRFSDGCWYKYTKKGVTKENAIRIVCDACKITSGDIIAFGDDYADIGMLKLAGVGVAMGNAIAEVKAVADIVIGTNDEDGIAEYLGGLV